MTFEEYVRRRGAALVRLAFVLTRDVHLAEDLTQDVLARAFVHWDRITRVDQPDLYTRRMLVNANLSRWRRRSAREIVDDRLVGWLASTDHGTAVAERDAMWRRVLTLPRQQRATVVLRYYEDLDDATIAQILGCSPSTVRTNALRALASLRTQLGGPRAARDPAVHTSDIGGTR